MFLNKRDFFYTLNVPQTGAVAAIIISLPDGSPDGVIDMTGGDSLV
jgi:hypothetical protein